MNENTSQDKDAALLSQTDAGVLRVTFRICDDLPMFVIPQQVLVQSAFGIPITRIPGTKPWLLGVLALRGLIMPVFDIQLWTGRSASVVEESNLLIVLADSFSGAFFCKGKPQPLHLQESDHTFSGDTMLQKFIITSYTSNDGVHGHEFDCKSWFRESSLTGC